MRKLYFLLAAVLLFLGGCITGGNNTGDILDGQTSETDSDLEEPRDVVEDEEEDQPVIPDETGCPSTEGLKISGAVRLSPSLKATPEATGTGVLVKMPCGREEEDASKDSCGTGHVGVWLCTTADCSDAADPIREHLNPEGSLKQSSFDSEPFAFCGLEAGDYFVLPVVDHDANGQLSNYDWTMGVKDLGDNSVAWPARVAGHPVSLSDTDIDLGEALTGEDASPVVVDYFNYRHPTPTWKPGEGFLFIPSTMHPDVSTTGEGMRAIDLSAQQELDMIEGTDAIDARSFADPSGERYEGTLTKLAIHDGVAYLATDLDGVIFTAALGADGSVEQGETIDLVSAGLPWGVSDVLHFGVVLDQGDRQMLALSLREDEGKPVPHQPSIPLILVDITTLQSDGLFDVTAVDAALIPALEEVRFDELVSSHGLIFAAETGANSRARRDDGLNQVWAFSVEEGVVSAHAYPAGVYNAEGDVPECGSNPPYRRAGIWAGTYQDALHVFLGGLRTVSVWRFDTPAVDGGVAVRHGAGVDEYDTRVDDYSVGYSLLRVDPEGERLYVIGDCKSRYLSVRPEDWAGGEGSRTQSRRRIAAFDLTSVDADGLPTFDENLGDSTSAPDVVRVGLDGADETLSEDLVMGIGMDCRAILWDIYDTYGYLNVAGSTFGSDCVINRARDAVVTEDHIYVIGEGSTAYGTTGLGVASEVLVLDIAQGQEVLAPEWQWIYEGSSYENRYGYFGLTLGERDTTEASKGLFWVK